MEVASEPDRRDVVKSRASSGAVVHAVREERKLPQEDRAPIVVPRLSTKADVPNVAATSIAPSTNVELLDRLAVRRTIVAGEKDTTASRPDVAFAIAVQPSAPDDAIIEQAADRESFADDSIDRRPVDADAAEMAEIGKPYQAAGGVGFDVTTRVNGTVVGRLTLFVANADIERPEDAKANISVKLSDIVGLLKPKMSQGLYDDLTSSTAAQQYVTLNDLRAHGIAVSFDHHDRLSLKVA